MQAVRITPSLAVADQIDERDVDALAAAGVKCVICNRPDSEGGTPSEQIRAACERHGMLFFMQPVEYSRIALADGEAFGRILQQSEGPALAYCRSGRRSTALWALAAAPVVGAPAVLQRAARAGVALDDISPLVTASAGRADPAYAPSSDPDARARFQRLWFGET
ncbi:MAG: TIGR01244 family phosphatase [Burkholderiaceae bacterium]|nr:TIGR01244 family phosphatase [Burkholderiaceae bacterium]